MANTRRFRGWITDAVYMANVHKVAISTDCRDLHFVNVSTGTVFEDVHLFGRLSFLSVFKANKCVMIKCFKCSLRLFSHHSSKGFVACRLHFVTGMMFRYDVRMLLLTGWIHSESHKWIILIYGVVLQVSRATISTAPGGWTRRNSSDVVPESI